MSETDIERQLTALARATAECGAGAGFVDRVMAAVVASEVGFWALVPVLGRRVVAGVAVAAVVAVGCASATRGSVDRALASSFNQIELEW